MTFISLWKKETNGTDVILKQNTNVSLVNAFDNLKTIDLNGFRETFKGYTGITGTVSFPKLTSIGWRGIEETFSGCTGITSVSFPALTSISSNRGMSFTFSGCTGITGTVSFPKLTTIGTWGMYYAFSGCTGITSVSFPELTTIDESGISTTFSGCTGITSVSFPKLTSIGWRGMEATFSGCTGITSVSFPKLTTEGVSITSDYDNPFYGCFYQCTGITAVHFHYTMTTYSDYLTKEVLFGGTDSYYCNTNLQILFDLGATFVNIIPNVNDYTLYFNGSTTTNPLHMPPEAVNTYYVYKDGYCLYKGSKTPTAEQEGQTITENVTMTTSGNKSTLNITIPTHTNRNTTNLTVEYYVDNIKFKTDTLENVSTNTTQTSNSVIVTSGTNITYKVIADGYDSVTNTITPSNNTINITLVVASGQIVEYAYPFTDNYGLLNNLVDNNNFVIMDTSSTPGSCIASGPSSYQVDNGWSLGYIEFTTPNTDDTSLLTLSVTCCSYSESNYDWGVVFINTTGNAPDYNTDIYTSEGDTDNDWGDIIYNGYSNYSDSYVTRTKVLAKNTHYYLYFYYKKDGGASDGWDRLAIQNIKIPTVG